MHTHLRLNEHNPAGSLVYLESLTSAGACLCELRVQPVKALPGTTVVNFCLKQGFPFELSGQAIISSAHTSSGLESGTTGPWVTGGFSL